MKKIAKLALTIAVVLVTHIQAQVSENQSVVTKKGNEVVTAEQVLDKYFIAVAGSKEKLEAITSLVIEGSTKTPEMPSPFSTTIKFESPNKMITIITYMGESMKQGFDGTKSFSSMGVISLDEQEEAKKQKGYFPELYYQPEEISFGGKVKMKRKEAYKIIITSGNKKKTNYYDVSSGLKLKEESIEKNNPIVLEYLEYKEFNGYKLPVRIVISAKGSDNMEQIIKNYIINPELTADDFK